MWFKFSIYSLVDNDDNNVALNEIPRHVHRTHCTRNWARSQFTWNQFVWKDNLNKNWTNRRQNHVPQKWLNKIIWYASSVCKCNFHLLSNEHSWDVPFSLLRVPYWCHWYALSLSTLLSAFHGCDAAGCHFAIILLMHTCNLNRQTLSSGHCFYCTRAYAIDHIQSMAVCM